MSDSTQAANVTAADDFEANRAKTKKALPALLIVFTLGTLMIQAFNLVFQNIGDSLGMSASASLISTLPGIVLGVVCMLYGTLCDFISPKRMTLFGVSALVIGSLLGFFGSFNFWVVLVARMIQVAGAQVAGSVFLVMTVNTWMTRRRPFTSAFTMPSTIWPLQSACLQVVLSLPSTGSICSSFRPFPCSSFHC